MSAGLSFIRACIDNSARGTFTGVGRSFYTEEEYRIFDFVQGYLTRYGALPTYSVMVENQMALASATGPVDYHLNRLSNRVKAILLNKRFCAVQYSPIAFAESSGL